MHILQLVTIGFGVLAIIGWFSHSVPLLWGSALMFAFGVLGQAVLPALAANMRAQARMVPNMPTSSGAHTTPKNGSSIDFWGLLAKYMAEIWIGTLLVLSGVALLRGDAGLTLTLLAMMAAIAIWKYDKNRTILGWVVEFVRKHPWGTFALVMTALAVTHDLRFLILAMIGGLGEWNLLQPAMRQFGGLYTGKGGLWVWGATLAVLATLFVDVRRFEGTMTFLFAAAMIGCAGGVVVLLHNLSTKK